MKILAHSYAEKCSLLEIYNRLDVLAEKCIEAGDMKGYAEVHQIIIYMSIIRETVH